MKTQPGIALFAAATATVTAAGLSLAGCSSSSSGMMPTSTGFVVTNLVSDASSAAMATYTDTNLVNAWGIAMSPTGPIWTANNGTQTSSLYDGNGLTYAPAVTLAAGTNGAADPTGIVYNAGSSFVITSGTNSGASNFLFDGEGGTILGWSQAVDAADALVAYDDGAGGAVYKGLAIASNGGADFLYATDFHNGKIDMFDGSFTKVDTTGKFTDPAIPAGYAPFGIQAINGMLYVTYAEQQGPDNHDEVDGAGLGYVDVYDAAGTLVSHLISTGALNAPWGMALAPTGFGPFAGDLLVGNFGDGVINAYDPATGAFQGALSTPAGKTIAIPGLWGISFGNGAGNQPATTLFIAAGINHEADGLYARIDYASGTTGIICTGYGC
jgi:uncharacterized protein (TIGR03118 family)